MMSGEKTSESLETSAALIRDMLVLPVLAASDDLPALLEALKDFYLIALPGALADLGRNINPQSLRTHRGWQRAVASQKAFLEPIVYNRVFRCFEADYVLGRPGRGLASSDVIDSLSVGGLDVGRGMCLEALQRLVADGWLELRRRRYRLVNGAVLRMRALWAPEDLYGVLLGLPRVLLQRARGVPGSRLWFATTMMTPKDLADLMAELRVQTDALLDGFGVPRSQVPPGREHHFVGLNAAAFTGPQQASLAWHRPASPAVKALIATVGAHLGVQIGTLDQALTALQRAAVVHLYRVYERGRRSSDHVEEFFAARYGIQKHDTLMTWRRGPMPEEGEDEPLPLNGGYVGEALQEIRKFLTHMNSEVVSESRIRAHCWEICSAGAAKPDTVSVALERLVQEASIIRVSGRARPQGEDGYLSQTRILAMPSEEHTAYWTRLRNHVRWLPGMVDAAMQGSPISHAYTQERVAPRSEAEGLAEALLSVMKLLSEKYNRPYAAMSEAQVKALGGQAFTLMFQCYQVPVIPRKD